MTKNSLETPKKTIKSLMSCGVDWIVELCVLSEIFTDTNYKLLTRFSFRREEFIIIIFYKAFKIIEKDFSKFLLYTYLSEEEISKLKGFDSLSRVKETHLKIKEGCKLIQDIIGSYLFANVVQELENVDFRYEIEYAKKEWMRNEVEMHSSLQNENYSVLQKENVSALKSFNDLKDIIDQIKNGAKTVTKVAAFLGVSRNTIHKRLKAADTSFKQLLLSVTSVT